MDPDHTALSILGMTTSYFAAAPILSEIVGRDLLAPKSVEARKRALLDFLDHGIELQRSEVPMTGRKFVVVLGVLFLIALVVYMLTTPRGNDIPLTGVVDGNEVIVSPQITGRMVKLKVDEGSEVKKGDLIAELDPKELEANLAAAKANVASLEHQVNEANHNYTWTNDQTGASIEQASARVTSSKRAARAGAAWLWRATRTIWRGCRSFSTREKFRRRTATTPRRP